MTESATIGFGLAGFGAWGRHHARAIAETDGAELRAIAVPSGASQEAARAAFPGAFVTADYRKLCERDDVAVIDAVLPTHLHCDVAVAALGAGKHLLLEKPMAATLAECREVLEASRASGCVLAIGHELRLSSQWGEIKSIISRGEIGEPQYVLVELSRRPYRRGAGGWRYDRARVGSWILEEPIHFLDLARWYLSGAGSPVEVYAAANARDAEHPELQDNFSAILKWRGGPYAVISQTLGAFEHHQTVKVCGTAGALWAGWSGAMDRTERPACFLRKQCGGAAEVEDVALAVPSGELFELRFEIERMVESVRKGTPPAATGEDGLWSVGLCLAAQQSVGSGRPVDIGAFLNGGIVPAVERETGR